MAAGPGGRLARSQFENFNLHFSIFNYCRPASRIGGIDIFGSRTPKRSTVMSDSTRRTFLKQTAGSAAGTAALLAAPALGALGANERLVLGLIGCGGRGSHVADVFRAQKQADVAWVCDADSARRGKAAEKFGVPSANAVADMRKLLDDPTVDAVLVATPDHWHSPAAILACQAGKHVYVEKPCSHNVREGRLLVEAARNKKRLVQHGTQSRSTGMMIEAVQALREGIIGDVLATR